MSCLALFAATVFASTQFAFGSDQDIAKLNRFVQTTKANTASMQIFREGRDFIEAQNWQKAAEKFADFIKAYPKDKDLDAALYWYGYALEKQGRKEEAAVPLLRLIERFPNSSWRRDAQALLVVLGRRKAKSNRRWTATTARSRSSHCRACFRPIRIARSESLPMHSKQTQRRARVFRQPQSQCLVHNVVRK